MPAICRRAPASISPMRGWTAPRIRSAAARRPTCGSPPATARRISPGAVLGVLHETGHALYERGLPERWARQPVGESAGMAAHESQSLIIEMQACRSDAFCACSARCCTRRSAATRNPMRRAIWRRLWRRIERGFIRVDADEMTYPAHVILRFRLEQAMVGGDLAVADLPGAWNEGMRDLLGITPPDDAPRLPAGHPLVRWRRSAISRATRWARWRRRN